MTPEWCVGKCKLAGYKYAGLQYGYLCFCGDRFGTYGKVDDAECDSLCFGDKTRYCGAFWHNSIFSVGKSSTRNEKVLSCSIIQNKFPIQTCNMNSRKRKINATNIPKKNFPHSNTLWSFFFFDQDREKHEPPAKDEPEEQEDSGSGESVEEPEDKYGWCSSLIFN